jgi:hypothetical protein
MSTGKLNKQQMRSETRPNVRKVRAQTQMVTIKQGIHTDKTDLHLYILRNVELQPQKQDCSDLRFLRLQGS